MWEQIRANKRKAVWLIILMGSILLLMGYAIMEAVVPGAGPMGALIAAVIFVVQMLVYSLAGESILMAGLGARPLPREESPRLYNLVEEMQLASGLGYMPQIYLMDTDVPNAFAVGRKPETSIVAVTRGLMYRLNRDELQGVVAHEVAHLKNLDTRFMTLAGVMLGSIIIMSDMGMRMFFYGNRGRSRSSSRGRNDVGGHPAFLLIALLLVILGPIVAQLLYFALSRTREYLADASAAVYTRYPEGLASALHKIAGASGPASHSGFGEVNRAVAPMFIINPLQKNALAASDSMFSTHPPVIERIRVLRSMGGASFADYDQAFRSVRNTRKPVIGERTLAAGSAAVPVRAPSGEGSIMQPIQTRDETKAIVHAMYGYADLPCSCGARLKVPSTYREPTLRCIRCGQVHETPALTVHEDTMTPAEKRRKAKQEARNKRPAVLEYTRKSPGAWEGFPCECGKNVQLSPIFSADHVECRACGQIYRVNQPTTV